jgi:hypothetical protein
VIIQMSRPWQHPQTGVWYFRSRVPADLKGRAVGRTVSVNIGREESTIRLSEIVKVSLRTKSDGEARQRHSSVQAQFEQRWAALRASAVALSHREIMALAGQWYSDLVSAHQDEPGEADGWVEYLDKLREGLAYLDPESDGLERPEVYDPEKGVRLLSKLIHVDDFLGAKGLSVDDDTKTKLVEQIAVALTLGARTLIRRANGDYRPDKAALTFPAWERRAVARPTTPGSILTMGELLDGWAKEAKPKQSTVDQWRSSLEDFTRYVGRDDAKEIARSDVIKWKQHLLDLGLSAKTINDSKLAALKAIFRWAVDNELLPANPASSVSVRRERKAGEKMLGFTKDEAGAILKAAAQQKKPELRWVPLLCAQSGARVSEVCQLRKEDILCEEGVWCMSFRAEAGSLKTITSERKVPLHRHVIQAGFLEFVAGKPHGPATAQRRGEEAPAKDCRQERGALGALAWDRCWAEGTQSPKPRLAAFL